MKRESVDEVISSLVPIINEGYELLEDVGFEECYGVRELVHFDEGNPNTEYKLRVINRILCDISEAQRMLDFLVRRENKPIHIVRRVQNGRFGYLDDFGDEVEFHCGHILEALLTDDEGRECWLPTRVEHKEGRYYLVGHAEVSLEGLLIRDGN